MAIPTGGGRRCFGRADTKLESYAAVFGADQRNTAEDPRHCYAWTLRARLRLIDQPGESASPRLCYRNCMKPSNATFVLAPPLSGL